jgi:hypothetical protein
LQLLINILPSCITLVLCIYSSLFIEWCLIPLSENVNMTLSPNIATYIYIYVPFSFLRIILFGLLIGIVLPLCTFLFRNLLTFSSLLVVTISAAFSYRFSYPSFLPYINLQLTHNLSFLLIYNYLVSEVYADNMCCTLSSNSCLCSDVARGCVCNVCFSRYFVCNAWYYSVIISLRVSRFTSPGDCQRNLFFFSKALPNLLTNYSYIKFISHLFFDDTSNLILCPVNRLEK